MATDPTAAAQLSAVVATAGRAITDLDIAESHPTMLVIDVSCNVPVRPYGAAIGISGLSHGRGDLPGVALGIDGRRIFLWRTAESRPLRENAQ